MISVLCCGSPDRFLAKKKAGLSWSKTDKTGTFLKMDLALGPLGAEKVPVALAGRVTSVLRAVGPITARDKPHGGRFFNWLVDLAARTGGAVLVGTKVDYIDRSAEVAHRLDALFAAEDFAGIETWVRDPGDDGELIADQALERIVKLAKARDVRVAGALAALSEIDPAYDPTVHVLAAVDGAPLVLRRRYDQLLDNRQASFDHQRAAPVTVAELRAIYETADVRSLARLRARMSDWFWSTGRGLVFELAASGWDPPDKIAELVIEDAQIAGLTDEVQLARLASEEFAQLGPLAEALHDRAVRHREKFFARATERASYMLAEYEKYRDDPLVTNPRARGMEPALYRGICDALYGVSRDRPRLPHDVVVMICDRRFDDAYTACLASLGDPGRAEAAVRDAIAHFTPGAAFTPP